MSWENDHYKITCKNCGNIGQLTLSSDDWNRFESTWAGFKDGRAYQFNPYGSTAICEKCGQSEIEIIREPKPRT